MKFILFLSGLTLLATSCSQKEYSFGEVYNKIEGISDTWRLTEVKLADYYKGDISYSYEVTGMFVKTTPLELTFNQNMTFTSNSGSSDSRFYPNVFNGNWSFDDNDYPTTLTLNDGINSTTMKLLGPTRIIDRQLKFQFRKPECNGHIIAYNFIFQRN